jgi:hypothetical protein
MNVAREKVRVARALEGLPGINAAFEKGELSFSKVRAMTRAATLENEPFLLMIADHGTAQHMEILVRAFRYVGRLEDESELNKFGEKPPRKVRRNTRESIAWFLVTKTIMACGIFKLSYLRKRAACWLRCLKNWVIA